MRAQAHGARRGHGGFTLLELATVLGILGVLTLTMTSAFEGMQQARLHNNGIAQTETARQALRAYVLRNKRLPCPDTGAFGDRGREADGAGSCPPGASTGWLPYETLSLEVPERSHRLRYGVHRSAAVDLVSPIESWLDEPDLEGRSSLSTLLSQLAASPADASALHYTTDFHDQDTTCTGADLINPAFVLAAPVSDLDRSGDPAAGFDGPNRGFANGSLCVASPTRPSSAEYDDIVVAESATALLGWLASSTR